MNNSPNLLRKYIMLCTALAVFACAGATADAAPVTFSVNVNTTQIAGQNGFISAQFNPGADDTLPATARLINFAQTGGSLAATSTNSLTVIGTLPALVTFGNSGGFNELFQGDTFGSSFRFDITIDGMAGQSTSTTVFALSLLGSDETTPLLSLPNAEGTILRLQVRADGLATILDFNPAFVIITQQGAAPVPEPATMILLGTGLTGVVGAVRKRRKRHGERADG